MSYRNPRKVHTAVYRGIKEGTDKHILTGVQNHEGTFISPSILVSLTASSPVPAKGALVMVLGYKHSPKLNHTVRVEFIMGRSSLRTLLKQGSL